MHVSGIPFLLLIAPFQSAFGYGSSYAGAYDDEFDEDGDDFVPGLGGLREGSSATAQSQESSCSLQ